MLLLNPTAATVPKVVKINVANIATITLFLMASCHTSLFSPDQKWRFSVIGVNVTDEQYLTFAGPAPFRPTDGDDQLVGLGRGRQVFAELAYNF